MGMYCDETAGDKIIDGTEDCVAVLHKDSDHIEIWDTDCEGHYGNVPADFSPSQINVAMRFYHAGEKAGREYGACEKQHEMRRVLGLN